MNSRNPILENAKRYHDYENEFVRTFGVTLSKFWQGNIFGFDIIAFDAWMATPRNKSCAEHVEKQYGKQARILIRKLIGAIK